MKKNEVIKTPYGDVKVKDVKLTPYGEGTYILACLMDKCYYEDGSPYVTLPNMGNPINYILLGFDAPIKGDMEWRFWIEFGDIKGCSDTISANLTPEEEQTIKNLYQEYRNKSVA